MILATTSYGSLPLGKPSKTYERGGWSFTEHTFKGGITLRSRTWDLDPKLASFDIYMHKDEWEWGKARLWTVDYHDGRVTFTPGPAAAKFSTHVSSPKKDEERYILDCLSLNKSFYLIGFVFSVNQPKVERLDVEESKQRCQQFDGDTDLYEGDDVNEEALHRNQ
jgi:hypothetical protein